MNKILLLILFILMITIGGKQGFKLFISLIINFVLLMISFYLMVLGCNPILVSLIVCLIISYIILYFVNGENIKTNSSFKSVIIILIILSFMILLITKLTRIAGFGYESYEEINMFSYDVHLDFTNVSVALILIGLIGATVDTSIAISSALYEVHENNKQLSKKKLIKSGYNIGKDILGTTINTLLFAFLGEFMTLIIWFNECKYNMGDILNAKVFASEFIKILFSGIGCILIIPVTIYITTYHLKNNLTKRKQ